MKSIPQSMVIQFTCIGLYMFLLSVGSCDFIRIKEKKDDGIQEDKPVARVDDTYLYAEDLKKIMPAGIPLRDSALWMGKYIDRWIKRRLFMTEALKQIDAGGASIEKKVNDYRNSLIEYQFRKSYAQKHLIDSISETEIQTYYDDHRQNFTLNRDLIKATYVKMPRGTPRVSNLRSLIYADNDKKTLTSYCLRFSTLYHLNDSVWVDLNKLILGSPIAEIQDKMVFLQRHKYYETGDADFLYYLKIDDYKLAGDISPLEFVIEDIKAFIINKRKVKIAQKQEQEIYKNAIEGQDFERYAW